jgi:hypothetical protein
MPFFFQAHELPHQKSKGKLIVASFKKSKGKISK